MNTTKINWILNHSTKTDYTHIYTYTIPALFIYLSLTVFLQNRVNVGPLKSIWYIFNLLLAIYNLIICKTVTLFLLFSTNMIDYEPSSYELDLFPTFFISKYVEMFNTFFIIFSGKKVTFLHSYNNIMSLIFAAVNIYFPSHATLYFILFNSFVNTIMYFYYAATCIGIRFKYKEAISLLQLFQMIFCTAILLQNIFVNHILISYFGLFLYISCLAFFGIFYFKKYIPVVI